MSMKTAPSKRKGDTKKGLGVVPGFIGFPSK